MLAERIVDLLSDREKARTMAGRAGERVRKEFALETVVARQAALYRELIDHAVARRLNGSMREH
jgi:glycosyltransferase involved in cell wall biosynthesis